MLGKATEEPRKERRKRVPVGGARYKLQLSQEDQKEFIKRGMVPRWFNDEGGRISAAKAGGWNFVKPEHAMSLGDGALHGGSTDLGGKVSKIVNRGEPVITAYLMEIPKEFWDEDQASKEKINRQVDEALALGGAQPSELENAYRPK